MLARHENVPSFLDLTRILKPCFKRNNRSKFQEKEEQTIPHDCTSWLIKKSKELSSKLTRKVSLLVSGKQANKQVDSSFPFSDFQKFFGLFGLTCHLGYICWILKKNFQVLLKFGFKFFIYHGKTFRRQVSFCISL